MKDRSAAYIWKSSSSERAWDKHKLEHEFGKLSHDKLTADLFVWQRVKGHRYSIDDVLTAREALRSSNNFAIHSSSRSKSEQSYLDLGCGIGSVLLMVASNLKPTRIVGVEAQKVSFELARRNVSDSSLHVSLLHQDFRTLERPFDDKPFDLITGTPPYAKKNEVLAPPDSQKKFARVEMRGGVEDYLDSALSMSHEESKIILCASARQKTRMEAHAKKRGVFVARCVHVIPREGKAPLFFVWTFQRVSTQRKDEFFVARKADGSRHPDYHQVRERFGFRPGIDS